MIYQSEITFHVELVNCRQEMKERESEMLKIKYS